LGGGVMEMGTRFWWENPEERISKKNWGVDGRVIL
jgi:hypothetical protein